MYNGYWITFLEKMNEVVEENLIEMDRRVIDILGY